MKLDKEMIPENRYIAFKCTGGSWAIILSNHERILFFIFRMQKDRFISTVNTILKFDNMYVVLKMPLNFNCLK